MYSKFFDESIWSGFGPPRSPYWELSLRLSLHLEVGEPSSIAGGQFISLLIGDDHSMSPFFSHTYSPFS